MIKWRHNFNKQGLFFQLPIFLALNGLYIEDFEKSLNPPSFPLELSSIYSGVICQFVEKKNPKDACTLSLKTLLISTTRLKIV